MAMAAKSGDEGPIAKGRQSVAQTARSTDAKRRDFPFLARGEPLMPSDLQTSRCSQPSGLLPISVGIRFALTVNSP